MNSVSRLCSCGQTFRILTFFIHVIIRSTLVWAERTLFPSLLLRIPIDIHHDRSNRNQCAAEDRGGFYRLAEDRCAENDAEQDSGVVVDTDLGCRGEYSPIGSTTIMRSFVARNTFTSSRFAAKDLPEPGTPRNRPLGFLSFFRFAMMTLWESALSP